MTFYRANLRTFDDCSEPALPEGLGFLIVVYGSDYAVLESDWPDNEKPPGVCPVPEGLARLLSSGSCYPPARALAMEGCERLDLDYSAMCERLSSLLLLRCLSQPEDGFRFLRAYGHQAGYLTRGKFYWVLGYVSNYVYWVSFDYQIYTDPCSEFGLEERELPLLFPNGWRREWSRSA